MIYVLENINKVFAHNVRRLRADRKQEVIAEMADDMPIKTYQRYEKGILPRKKAHLLALCRAFKVKETSLFLDPDLAEPSPAKIAEALAKVLAEPSFSHQFAAMVQGILLEHANKKNPNP